MLRTGGPWVGLLPEGALALAGAAGRQVWIGGRRLDLGAVEVELLLEPSIVEAAVLGGRRRQRSRSWPIWWSPEHGRRNGMPSGCGGAGRKSFCRPPGFPEPPALTPTGRLDEAALLRLPVIDGELIAHWEESLCALPEIREPRSSSGRPPTPSAAPLRRPSARLEVDRRGIGRHRRRRTSRRDHGRRRRHGSRGSGSPAIAHGPALALPTGAPVTCRSPGARCLEHPENGITYLRSDGSAACQTYPELLEASQRLLAGLRELGLKPQDKLLFQLPDLATSSSPSGRHARWIRPRAPVHPSHYEQANSALDKLANAGGCSTAPGFLWRETSPPCIPCPTCSI